MSTELQTSAGRRGSFREHRVAWLSSLTLPQTLTVSLSPEHLRRDSNSSSDICRSPAQKVKRPQDKFFIKLKNNGQVEEEWDTATSCRHLLNAAIISWINPASSLQHKLKQVGFWSKQQRMQSTEFRKVGRKEIQKESSARCSVLFVHLFKKIQKVLSWNLLKDKSTVCLLLYIQICLVYMTWSHPWAGPGLLTCCQKHHILDPLKSSRTKKQKCEH